MAWAGSRQTAVEVGVGEAVGGAVSTNVGVGVRSFAMIGRVETEQASWLVADRK